MLTPYELANAPKNIVKIYQELEDFIIEDISRRIAKAGKITDTAAWQLQRAKEFGMADKALKEHIAKTLNKSYKEINSLFNEYADMSVSHDNSVYEKAGLSTINLDDSTELQDYLKAAIKQTKGELKNICNSLGFCYIGVNGKIGFKDLTQFYIDTLDLTQMQVSSGVLDYNAAVRQAVKKLSQSGIRTINYDTGYQNRINVAVRRATLTGVNQMSQKMTESTIEELGCEFVEVSAHAGARPSHQVWQGQVYCYKGKSDKYPDFVSSTGYGTVEGLGGANCRHSFFPFFPDISKRAYTDEQLKNIDPEPFEYNGKSFTFFDATQYQRKLERNIRDTKRELIGYNAAGLDEDFTNASIKLQQQKKEYDAFSKAADIDKQNERIQVMGYGKSISQKSVWRNKKK